jgi:hypothetical protein
VIEKRIDQKGKRQAPVGIKLRFLEKGLDGNKSC